MMSRSLPSESDYYVSRVKSLKPLEIGTPGDLNKCCQKRVFYLKINIFTRNPATGSQAEHRRRR